MQLTSLICLALLCAALSARAQAPVPAPAATSQPEATNAAPATAAPPPAEARKTRVLTLEEAMRLALQHNLDIQITRYTPLLDQYALSGDYSAWDPLLRFTAVHSLSVSPGQFNAIGVQTVSNERNANTYSPDISGGLPSGLTYDVSAPLTEQSGTFIQPSDYTGGPTITLRQPVLKNLWTDTTRYTIQVAKLTLRIDQLTLRLRIMTVIFSVKEAYYNVMAAREQVKVDQEALELANRLVEENKRRVQVGSLAPLDEKQSESQAASSLASLQAAEQALNTAENVLKNLLTDDYAAWADVTLIPSEVLVAVPVTLDLQESWRRGLAQRAELQQAQLAAARQRANVRYTSNQLLPDVELTGSYGRSAVNPSLGQFYSDIWAERSPSYTYGLSISIPLGNISARAAAKSAKALASQAELTEIQQRQTIMVQDRKSVV